MHSLALRLPVVVTEASPFLELICVVADVLIHQRNPKDAKEHYNYLTFHYHHNHEARAKIESFEAPKLLRRLRRARAPKLLDGELPSVPEVRGQILLFYRRPFPNEHQAQIAYENVAERWRLFLLRKRCPILVEASTQLRIFIPEGVDFQLEPWWNEFIQEDLFSREHLASSLLPLLNLSRLSDRGFSVPEALLVSPGMRDFFAAWYFRVFCLVEERIAHRQRKLVHGELTESKRKELQKMQDKETTKYPEHLERYFRRMCVKMEKHQVKVDEQQATLDALQKPSGKRYETCVAKLEALHLKAPYPPGLWERIASLVDAHGFDPFVLLRVELEEHPEVYAHILSFATRFQRRAAEQLSQARGDIFAMLWFELLRLANTPDTACALNVPCMFSMTPMLSRFREAGDGGTNFCFSCGIALDKKEPSFEIRRMVFSSPEQRLQSGASPTKPKSCVSCAAYSYVCGVKPTDDGIIVKIVEPAQAQGSIQALTQNMARMLTNKEMNVQAGPYMMMGCRDFVLAKGGRKSVSSVIGTLAYAHYRLAQDVHPLAFSQLRFFFCHRGQEQALSSASLIWLHALLEASKLSIVTRERSLSGLVSKALRYVLDHHFLEAEYTFASAISANSTVLATFQRTLAPFRQSLWNALNQEEGMEHAAKQLRHIAGMTGILSAFVHELKLVLQRDPNRKPADIKRELAKLIEQCNDPIHWDYYFASYKGVDLTHARLFRNHTNTFLYQQTKQLLKALGIKSGEREQVSDKGTTFLQLYQDDVKRAFHYFWSDAAGESSGEGAKPPTKYEQDEFVTKLRLSLYSQFPQVISRHK